MSQQSAQCNKVELHCCDVRCAALAPQRHDGLQMGCGEFSGKVQFRVWLHPSNRFDKSPPPAKDSGKEASALTSKTNPSQKLNMSAFWPRSCRLWKEIPRRLAKLENRCRSPQSNARCQRQFALNPKPEKPERLETPGAPWNDGECHALRLFRVLLQPRGEPAKLYRLGAFTLTLRLLFFVLFFSILRSSAFCWGVNGPLHKVAVQDCLRQ